MRDGLKIASVQLRCVKPDMDVWNTIRPHALANWERTELILSYRIRHALFAERST